MSENSTVQPGVDIPVIPLGEIIHGQYLVICC